MSTLDLVRALFTFSVFAGLGLAAEISHRIRGRRHARRIHPSNRPVGGAR